MLSDSADFPVTIAEIVTALQQDPILIEETMGSGHTAQAHERLTALAHELPYPVHIALVSQPTDLDDTSDAGVELATALHKRLQQPGLYIVETSQHRAPTVQAYGIGVDSTELDLQAYANVSHLQDRMPGKDHQVYLAPAVDAEAAIETARHRLPPLPTDDGPLPQSLPGSVTDRLMAEQDTLMKVGSDDGDPTGARILAATGVGVGLLAVVPALVLLLRRQRRKLQEASPARAQRRGLVARRLTADDLADVRRQAGGELAALAEELRDLASPAPVADAAQQATLDHDTADTLLRDGAVPADLIGALVLARAGRRDVVRAGGARASAYRPCFFDPLHGEAAATVEWEYGEGDVAVPVCRDCRASLQKGTAVSALRLRGRRPYFEDDDVWARTGFGSLADDLASQVMRDRSGSR